MALPRFLLQHSVSVEAYLGATGRGPTYGAAATVKCFKQNVQKLIRTPSEGQVLSTATLYVNPDVNIPLFSRVTLDGRTATVLTVKILDGGGFRVNDHLEVYLT